MVLTISGVVRVCADRVTLGLAAPTKVFHKKYDILHVTSLITVAY